MANFTLSPNMSIPVPTVSVDPGPDWAFNLNAGLGILDSHNHTTGQGVQVPPGGLNINSDLTFLSNNATNLRSVRFTSNPTVLTGASDLGCIYRVLADLWYNDGNGNEIRITQSGGVAGTPGSISGLVAPASATYVSANQTFVWQSAANTPANLDAGSIIIRNITANSHGVTLSAPAALAADYTLTLPPALPSQTALFSVSSSGTMSFASGVVAFDAVIGSAAQVTSGLATHSTWASAIAAVSANASIRALQGAWTENVTVNKTLTIVGSGPNTIITGTFSITGASYTVIQGVSFSGNLVIDSSSNGNILTNSYIGASSSGSDSGNGNFIQLTQG